jgi:hypothetical protein
MVDTVKTIAGIGVVLVAAAIVIGGWQLGWWLKTSATNRTPVIYQHSSVAQLQSLISQIGQLDLQLVDANTQQSEKAALTPQKSALVNLACRMSASITSPLPSTEAAFVASNC